MPVRKNLRKLLALALVLVMLAAACGADDEATSATADGVANMSQRDSDDSGDGGDTSATTAAADSAGEVETSGGDDAVASETTAAPQVAQEPDTLGSGGAAGVLTAADIGRKIIFTATLTVEVDDVAAAGTEATRVILDMGGFVNGQNTVGGPEPSSELVFKVLPEQFDEALARLGEIGELRNQTRTTDDVTERVVSLERRISVAEAGVERLAAAMENAPDLEQFAALEQLLLERESNLEVMRGQLVTLESQVNLATITLRLTQDRVENSVAIAVSAYEGHDDGASCPNQNIVRAEEGSDVTLCMEITNAGDQTLREIVVTDTVLGINADNQDQLIAVFEPLVELAPGQSAIVAYELKPERNLRPRTRVAAVPTDGVSTEAAGPSVSTTQNYDITVFEPDTDPGFTDGFNAAKSILSAIWTVLKLVAGFMVVMIIPALVLFPVFWLARRWWLQRTEAQRLETERIRVEAQTAQPAPPATVAAPPGPPEPNDPSES